MEYNELKEASVPKFGGENEFLVRIEKASEDIEKKSQESRPPLQGKFKDKAIEIRRAKVVGPRVAEAT